MTPFDREVRAKIYEMFRAGAVEINPDTVAREGGWAREVVKQALSNLEAEHRLVLKSDGAVWMAHPFSGVDTGYRAHIGDSVWNANCAWDALAILALLGDGRVEGPNDLTWDVREGRVEPNGVVNFVVPVSRFWEDIGFT